MTVKGGTIPACAACKYQRRKCSPSCPLAPYFPANHPEMFENVHRLFGVSNVTKILEKIKTQEHKDDAMRSIIYEAEMRKRFPVDGCCAVIAQLRHQLHLTYEELYYVCGNLEASRAGPSMDCWLAPPPPPQYGVSQFFLNENGDDLCASSDTMSSNLTSVQTQMNAFDIHERNNIIETKMEAKDAFESSPESSEQRGGCRSELRSAAAGFSLTTVN